MGKMNDMNDNCCFRFESCECCFVSLICAFMWACMSHQSGWRCRVLRRHRYNELDVLFSDFG